MAAHMLLGMLFCRGTAARCTLCAVVMVRACGCAARADAQGCMMHIAVAALAYDARRTCTPAPAPLSRAKAC
eukprot:8910498-Alexandrium_andersonii.AAC.1